MIDHTKAATKDLEAKSRELDAQAAKNRAERKAINDELSFRGNLEARTKALRGLSGTDIKRVIESAQALSDAGSIGSDETVEGTGLKG